MTRSLWLDTLYRLAVPVLQSGANGSLSQVFPLAHHANLKDSQPNDFMYCLEAACRTLVGISPWLACEGLSGEEAVQQQNIRRLARDTVAVIADPQSPGFLLGSEKHQGLVEAAFLSQALLRAPHILWTPLPKATQDRILAALIAMRRIQPVWNNWLCFSAMVETAIRRFGGTPDMHRLDVCMKMHETWYAGDSMYRDGIVFHCDYYNSYVIHPMLIDILEGLQDMPTTGWQWGWVQHDVEWKRAIRYAQIQERTIAPDGTFPVIGRSITYRMAAFQTLALVALHQKLPAEIAPAQVRSALTAVLRRTLLPSKSWTTDGWLTIGLAGNQPNLGETYITSGSVYLTSTGLMPLGLPPSNPFWQDPDQAWTSVKAFAGEDLPADHAH